MLAFASFQCRTPEVWGLGTNTHTHTHLYTHTHTLSRSEVANP